MEAAVQAQRNFSCSPSFRDESQLNIKPFFGFFYKPTGRSSLLHLLCKKCPSHGVSYGISASADFSRRRQNKVSTPRSTSAPLKGFMPKAPAVLGMQKRDQRNKIENESSTTLTVGLDERTPEIGVDDDNGAVEISQEMEVDGRGNEDTNGRPGERSLVSRPPAAIVTINQLKENGSIVVVDKSKSVGALVKSDVGTTAIIETGRAEKSLDGFEANAIAVRDTSIGAVDDAAEIEASGLENVGDVDDIDENLQNVVALPKVDVKAALLATWVEGKNLDNIAIVESDESIAADDNITTKGARDSENFVAVDDGANSSQSISALPSADVRIVFTKAGLGGKDLDSTETDAHLDGIENILAEDIMPEIEASGSKSIGHIGDGDDSESTVTLSEAVDGTLVIETGLGQDFDSGEVSAVAEDVNGSSATTTGLEGQGLDRIEINAFAESCESIEADQDMAEVEATTTENTVDEEDEVEDSSQQLKLEREARLKLEREAQLKSERGAQLKLERDEQLKSEREAQLKSEREAQLKSESEAQLKSEREAQMKSEREAQLKSERESQLKSERESQLKSEREAQLKSEREAQLKLEREEHLKLEREAQVKLEREAQLKLEREEQVKLEREAQLKLEREAQVKLEREAQVKLEREEQLKLERETQVKLEREAQVKLEREAQLKLEREAQLKLEREAQLKLEREAQLKLEREAQLKLEREAQLKLEMEAQVRKQVIEQLAQETFARGNRLFIYPQVAKPDEDIEVFLNRSLSALKDEPDVMVMGAFNDWRWNSFTVKLEKNHLNGDWWSCKIHVPKQAYKIDFVFFNGKNVYDNNNKKDFHILVDGGMDASDFEDFFLEEKHKELEKLAKEQSERERRAEEQRHIEAEKAAREVDRAHAKIEVDKRREKLRELIKKAATSVDNVWYFELMEVKSKDRIRLYYNRSSGPLAQANDIWFHGGYNGWQDGLSIAAKLVKSERNDVDWWYAEVTIPDQARVLDWVFSNGPPHKAAIYDNNHRQDFHGIVPKSISVEKYWVEEEHRIYKKLLEERRLREEAIRAKAEKTAIMRAETKGRTLKRFLLSQKHVVYTDPLNVQAGSTVTVYYNPAHTVLNGKPEIWFRCSFNRWTHHKGLLPPQKMMPAENVTHVKTTVKVPLDVYMMDFVFSEREDGGIFDNKDGMDYHIPVFGGVAKEPPLCIVHIAVEMAPIAKVGGLGDVVTSLSRAVQDLNHYVNIILPKYNCMNLSNVKDLHYQRSYSWSGTEIKVWFGKVEGLSVYFLEPVNGFFQTGAIYGRNDAHRFDFFCHAALEFLLQSGSHPDIIHCHDWSSAAVAWLYKEHYTHYGLSKTRVVFTIHNLEFGAQFIGKAMAFTDKATTVSRTYSREVAGNPAVAPHLGKFHGILNGIDPDIWDPYNDKFIPVSYTSENVVEGKQAAKNALQQRLGLKQADLPLVGMITRLTHQKGIHLIKHAIWRTLERNGQVVMLGCAPDPRIQNDFVNLANQLHSSHGDRARLCLTYDEPLSHLIYAGADFILVPSVFEPCGLTQLVAMRYGSIPVVRKTGGLYDTVYDVDHDKERAQAQGLEPNGFSFEGVDNAGVDYALNRAISAWYDNRQWFYSLCKHVMEQDWSWNRPALDYLELYHAARKWGWRQIRCI